MLEEVSNNIWSVPAPLAVFGFIQLNTRMTVIRLDNGTLLLHSPVKWTEALNEVVQSLGDIAYIIAPSCFHHLFVGDWKTHHPNALLCGPKGLAKKRDDLTFDVLMSPAVKYPWGDEIDTISLQGMPIVQEYLLYHKASQTLVVTDCLFFLPESTGFTSFYAWINGVKSQVGMPLLFKSAIKDAKAFGASLEPLQTLPVMHLSLCHHTIVRDNATAQLRAALQKWLP